METMTATSLRKTAMGLSVMYLMSEPMIDRELPLCKAVVKELMTRISQTKRNLPT
jgi:hypothetical protein